MSMFWIGGEGKVVERGELNPEMYQDRYFLPGIIHGCESYLINIYLNDSRNCEEEADSLCVEFYKAEDVRHKRKFIEEFLYEYQQVLKHEEFQYEDFPQALTGPDYLAWTYWVEIELEKGKRIPYEEFVAIVKQGGKR